MTKGQVAMQTRAILQEKKAEMATPEVMQKKVSATVPMISVLRPLRFVISSEKAFEMIPGALSLRSNQETFL